MIQEETNLVVADNSGAKKVRCIRVSEDMTAGMPEWRSGLRLLWKSANSRGCREKGRRSPAPSLENKKKLAERRIVHPF